MIKQRAIPMKHCLLMLCELTDLYWIPVCLAQTRIECIKKKKKKKLYPHPCRVNTHLYHSSYQTMHIYIYIIKPSLFIQTLIHSNIYRIYRKLFFIFFKKIQYNNDDNKIRLNYIFNLTNKLSIFFTRFNFSVYSTIYISKEGYINVPYILRLIINIIRNSPNIINALCPALKHRERTVSERKRDTSIRDSIFRDANSVDGAPTVFIEFVVNRVLCTMYELEAYREYKWPRVHVDRWRARAGSLLSLVKATLVKSASTCLAK